MGFIVIAPFAVLAIWSIWSIYRWLSAGNYGDPWSRNFKVLAGIGLVLGVCFAFFLKYHIGKMRIEGFPIPVAFANAQKDGQWLEANIPAAVKYGAVVTNILVGVALCLAPMAVALFFKDNTGKKDAQGRPTI